LFSGQIAIDREKSPLILELSNICNPEKFPAHGLRLVATCPLAALTYLFYWVCSGDEV
jgi:hypothetical protein